MSVRVVNRPLKVFFSYSHEDDVLRTELLKHLAQLQREGAIESWHDRLITGGREWAGIIDAELDAADVILLLLSASFLASDYCNDVEVTRAIERHHSGEARVVPVILRPCDWQSATFGNLQALPRNGRPIIQWHPVDSGYLEVTQGLRRIIAETRRDSELGAKVQPAVERAIQFDPPNSSDIAPFATGGKRRALWRFLGAVALVFGVSATLLRIDARPPSEPVRVDWVRLDHIGFEQLLSADTSRQAEGEENLNLRFQALNAIVTADRDLDRDSQGRLGGWPSWKEVNDAARRDPEPLRDQRYWLAAITNTSGRPMPEIHVEFSDGMGSVVIRDVPPEGFRWIPIEMRGRHANLTRTQRRVIREIRARIPSSSWLEGAALLNVPIPPRDVGYLPGEIRGISHGYPRMDSDSGRGQPPPTRPEQ